MPTLVPVVPFGGVVGGVGLVTVVPFGGVVGAVGLGTAVPFGGVVGTVGLGMTVPFGVGPIGLDTPGFETGVTPVPGGNGLTPAGQVPKQRPTVPGSLLCGGLKPGPHAVAGCERLAT